MPAKLRHNESKNRRPDSREDIDPLLDSFSLVDPAKCRNHRKKRAKATLSSREAALRCQAYVDFYGDLEKSPIPSISTISSNGGSSCHSHHHKFPPLDRNADKRGKTPTLPSSGHSTRLNFEDSSQGSDIKIARSLRIKLQNLLPREKRKKQRLDGIVWREDSLISKDGRGDVELDIAVVTVPDAIGSAWSEASYVAGLYLKARTPYPQVIPHFIYDYHTYHVRRGDTLQPGWQAALDIGCGPGQLAIHLSTRFRRVLGIDPSEGMIALAETVKALGKEVLSSNGLPEVTQDSVIDYRKGFGESTNLSGKSVDLIVLGASAHCLDWSSPSATSSIWREWARILRPGGSLIITGTRPIVGPFVGPDGEKVGPLRDWLQNFALPPSPLATFYDQRVTEKSIGGGTMYSKIPMPWEQEDGDLCELWDSESKVHLVIDDPSPLNRSNQRIPSWASPALIRAIRGDNSNRDLIVTRTSPKHLTAWIRSTSGYRKMLEENFDQRLLALEERDVAAVEMKRICDESGIGWEEEMECHHPGTVLAIRRTRKEFPLGEATIKGT